MERPICTMPLQALFFPEGEKELLVDEKSMMDQIPTALSRGHKTEQGNGREVHNEDPSKAAQPTPTSQLSCNKSTATNISPVSADLLVPC